MIRKTHSHCLFSKHPFALKRVAVVLCLGSLFAVLPTLPFLGLSPYTQAFAQANSPKNEALFLAVENNNLTDVKEAIKSGAEVDAKDFNGMQPVDLAIDRGFFDIAHYLISIRNDQQSGEGSPMTAAPTPTADAPDTPASPFDAPVAETAPPPEPETSPFDAPVAETTPTVEPESSPFDAPIAKAEPDVLDATTAETVQISEPEPPETPVEEVAQTPEPDVTEPLVEEIVQQPEEMVQKAKEPTVPTNNNAQTQTFNEVKKIDREKASASKRFITTFMDFFKPANTTGIMRKERKAREPEVAPLTLDQLNEQLQELQAERGPVLHQIGPKPTGTQLMKNSEDAIQDARIAKALSENDSPPSATNQSTPIANSSEPARQSKKLVFDESKPFNGQVDPEVLAFLDNSGDTETGTTDIPSEGDPFADAPASTAKAEADPFAMPSKTDADPFADTPAPTAKAEADPFAPIDAPQDVAVLEPKSPPSRKAADPADPFASPTTDAADPFAEPDPFASAEPDVLDGLLDSNSDDGSKGATGWDVKTVEGATIPDEVQVLSAIEPTGNMLEGVELTLGADTSIGQEVGEDRLKLMDEKTIHKPCLNKGGDETIFCVDKVSWPFELEEDFLVDTIMYQGTSTVSRYDAGRATNFHALFKSIAFPRVISYYINRFGQPSEVVQRAVAPLAKPRMDNPTYIWRSREAGTDTTTSLEIRKFDDERGSFPDTRRGVIMLYRSHAGPIFPQLSQLELMVLKANGEVDTFAAPQDDSVW